MTHAPFPDRIVRSLPLQLAILLTVCFLVLWLRLGNSGMSSSEGFRAIPAWEALATGDWTVIRLFEQPYFRKPPGIVWSIGAASAILGTTEFAARGVSALATTVGALLIFGCATRWFGKPWGLCAGVAFICTPLWWVPSRSAEIEALHNLWCVGTLLAMLAAFRRADAARQLAVSVAVVLSSAGALLTKGPAAAPAVVAIFAGACLAARSWRPLSAWGIWLGLALGAGAFGAWALAVRAKVDELGLAAVTESGRFLWRPGNETDVLILPFVALASTLPWCIALPFALVRAGPQADDHARRADSTSRTVAWSVVLGLMLYTAIGVHNTRYTMPVLVTLPIAYAGALRRFASAELGRAQPPARLLFLGRPAIPLIGVCIAAIAYAQWYDAWRARRHTGKHSGIALAAVLPDGALVVGDEMIDTRPEVFWYAQREAERRGRRLRVVWTPGLSNPDHQFPRDAWIVIRDDENIRVGREPEWKEVASHPRFAGVEPAYRGTAHIFSYRVYAPRPDSP